MKPTSFIIKLADLILDASHPVDARQLPPDVVLARLRQAYGFLGANMTFAVEADRVVITIDSDRDHEVSEVKANFDKAVALAESKRYNKAVDLFRRVLAIVPDHSSARRNLAMALMASERQTEAKDVLVDLLRLDPANTWAYMLLGNIFARQEHNLLVAETYLKKAYELDRRDAYAVINYAALKTELGDVAGASALFEEAIALDPATPNPYYGLATLHANAGNNDDALAILERMFGASRFDDSRMQDLLKESRQYYLRLSAHAAETRSDLHWQWVLDFKSAVEQETGCPVVIQTDETLGSTAAKAEYAWESGGTHVVRYNPAGKAVVPAMVARELERIRVRHQDRLAGNPSRYAVKPTGSELTDSLLARCLAVPEDARIDAALVRKVTPIQTSLFVDVYLRLDEHARVMRGIRSAPGVPPVVIVAFERCAAVAAFFADLLLQPRTAYGALYATTGAAPRARELAEDCLSLAGTSGVDAALVEMAGLRNYVMFE